MKTFQVIRKTGGIVGLTDSPFIYRKWTEEGLPVVRILSSAVLERDRDEREEERECCIACPPSSWDGVKTPFCWSVTDADWRSFRDFPATADENEVLRLSMCPELEEYGLTDAFLSLVEARFRKQPWTLGTVMDGRMCIRELTEADMDSYGCREEGNLAFLDIQEMYYRWNFGIWGIFMENGIIGLAGFLIGDDGRLRMGYELKSEYRGRGYAFTACKAILDYAEEEMEYPEVVCVIDKNNIPSILLAGKLKEYYQKLEIRLIDKV